MKRVPMGGAAPQPPQETPPPPLRSGSVVVDERLLREATEFRFRHTCDDCVYFDGAACTHGYPTAVHRLPLAASSEVVFCKELELA